MRGFLEFLLFDQIHLRTLALSVGGSEKKVETNSRNLSLKGGGVAKNT